MQRMQFAIAHIQASVQNIKDLFTVINMPLVGRVCPIKTRSNTRHIGDIKSTPCSIGSEFFCSIIFIA